MTEIIVLGAGIGGVSMAYELRALVGRKANITFCRIRSGFTSCLQSMGGGQLAEAGRHQGPPPKICKN